MGTNVVHVQTLNEPSKIFLFFLNNVWSSKVLHMPTLSLIVALYKEIRVDIYVRENPYMFI